MNCTEGNLLVTIAIDFGGRPVDASASSSLAGTTFSDSNARPLDEKCMGDFASFGMPKVWGINTFWERWATAIADRMAPVAEGPRIRSTLSTVIKRAERGRAT